jgi:hypothetical protein
MYGYLLNHLVDFYEIWYTGDAIQGDLDAVIFNPKASTILKWLRFKFKIFSLAQHGLGPKIKACILQRAVTLY